MSARQLAAQVLLRVDRDKAYSHVALDAELAESDLSSVDRRLATRIVYGTLAWQRAIDRRLVAALEGTLTKRAKPFERAVLRSAVFQIFYLDRVPTHAAVHEAVDIVRRRRGKRGGGFINAILRRVADERDELPIAHDEVGRFGDQWSVSNQMAKVVLERYGTEGAERWAKAVNSPPALGLRANQSSAQARDDLPELAQKLGAEPVALTRWGMQATAMNETLRGALERGEVSMQAVGAQLVVEHAGDLDGVRVIWDMCAGQGGKTVQMLDLLRRRGGPGVVHATDIHQSKLQRLVEMVGLVTGRDLAPFSGTEQHYDLGDELELVVSVKDGRGPLGVKPDIAIVDAPCSGRGLVRRHPEVRWRGDKAELATLVVLQKELLDNALRSIAPGGHVVYAVCSDNEREGVGVVEDAMSRGATVPDVNDWPVSGLEPSTTGVMLHPHRHNTDGFFISVLRPRADP